MFAKWQQSKKQKMIRYFRTSRLKHTFTICTCEPQRYVSFNIRILAFGEARRPHGATDDGVPKAHRRKTGQRPMCWELLSCRRLGAMPRRSSSCGESVSGQFCLPRNCDRAFSRTMSAILQSVYETTWIHLSMRFPSMACISCDTF